MKEELERVNIESKSTSDVAKSRTLKSYLRYRPRKPISYFVGYLKTLFLATDPEVPGSILGASRFSEKQRVWNGVHSAS
jgi:hypothetical protein